MIAGLTIIMLELRQILCTLVRSLPPPPPPPPADGNIISRLFLTCTAYYTNLCGQLGYVLQLRQLCTCALAMVFLSSCNAGVIPPRTPLQSNHRDHLRCLAPVFSKRPRHQLSGRYLSGQEDSPQGLARLQESGSACGVCLAGINTPVVFLVVVVVLQIHCQTSLRPLRTRLLSRPSSQRTVSNASLSFLFMFLFPGLLVLVLVLRCAQLLVLPLADFCCSSCSCSCSSCSSYCCVSSFFLFLFFFLLLFFLLLSSSSFFY